MRVYISNRHLPASCRPAMISRYDDGMVLVVIHDGADLAEAYAWCRDHMTETERRACRTGLGLDPDSYAIPDYMFERLIVPEQMITLTERERRQMEMRG